MNSNKNIYVTYHWIVYLSVFVSLVFLSLAYFIATKSFLDQYSTILSFIMILFALLNLSVAVGLQLYLNKQDKIEEHLKTYGKKVVATFDHFAQSHTKISNTYKLKAVLNYKDENNQPYQFQSKVLKEYLDISKGDQFIVYYDPSNINLYFVDLNDPVLS